MLRSYQYTEKSYLKYSMQSDISLKTEIGYVKDFALAHAGDERQALRHCPICGYKDNDIFFKKWGMSYIRCSRCNSLFGLCNLEDENEYLKYQDLVKYRLSDDYQHQMTDNRKDSWIEFLEWLQVRSFRFLGKNKNLRILDVGNRLSGFVTLIRDSEICGKYTLTDSILPDSIQLSESEEAADIILCNDLIKTEYDPAKRFMELRKRLSSEGLLVIGARAGSGFDVLTLKEHNTRIVPYEHILLPSVKGLVMFLKNLGFEVLEITTPGVMDVKYVMDCLDELGTEELFVQTLLREADELILQEFQRFLQKSCMSSLIRVIARRVS